MSALCITGFIMSRVRSSFHSRGVQFCAAPWTTYPSSVSVEPCHLKAAFSASSAALDPLWRHVNESCVEPLTPGRPAGNPQRSVMLIGLLRYAHVIEKHQNCVLNTAGLSTAWICAAGLIMVGNFQVDFAKVLHYVGAGVAFPSSMLFVCLQSALTYRLAKTQEEYRVGHLRVGMALLALVALVLSGVFFCQESFALQHTSAIFEWIYCMLIMLFYGTFAFEFGEMSGDTLMVLSRGGGRGGGVQSFSTSECKMDAGGGGGGGSSNHHQPDNLSML
ncbi:transmembrane protein 150A-like isoform X4 [Cebidichthys violaceus]|uniref:transmembrane protein 150A-like isoform X4 n=1 Tax=Cebidichthys violaceus TaxID=271503 RepID=UPI0035CBFB65